MTFHWRRPLRYGLALVAAAALVLIPTGVFLAENALHIPPGARSQPTPAEAEVIALRTNATWRDVEIKASDGVPLRAWLFQPKGATRGAVIVLHGVADTRRGVLMQTQMLVESGYAVLAPDSRGHGVSGGAIATYGALEAGDVRRWARWLAEDHGYAKVYALGESLGAAIAMQALAQPSPLRAVVAEAPFRTFEAVGLHRMQQVSHLPQPLLWPFVRVAFLYAQWRYGVDLDNASPTRALATSTAPVLLIHGTVDTNIPPAHSEHLHALYPTKTALWRVANAPHVLAMKTAPAEFTTRVIAWFDTH